MNLILCGLPASGKTHVGKKISQHLGWNFIDTDHLIEQAYKESTGQSITCRELAKTQGEKTFRDWESLTIRSLRNEKQAVISTGGGTFLFPDNTKILKSIGIIVYLQIHSEMALERIKKESTVRSYLDPDHIETSFNEIIKPRLISYETSADHIIHIDGLEDHQVIKLITSKIVGDHHGEQ